MSLSKGRTSEILHIGNWFLLFNDWFSHCSFSKASLSLTVPFTSFTYLPSEEEGGDQREREKIKKKTLTTLFFKLLIFIKRPYSLQATITICESSKARQQRYTFRIIQTWLQKLCLSKLFHLPKGHCSPTQRSLQWPSHGIIIRLKWDNIHET
jgi:hypothetical protein